MNNTFSDTLTNARNEFLTHVEDRRVIAAYIMPDDRCAITLQLHHSQEDYDIFLNRLAEYNYEFDQNTPKLSGVIWYDNNTYSDRIHSVKDWDEWWEYRIPPEIPVECFPND
jgi:hypothetical protein